MFKKNIFALNYNKTLLAITCIATLLLIYVELSTSTINVFLISFSMLTILFIFLEKKSYIIFSLLSTFTLITSWRLAVLASHWLISYFYLLAFIFVLMQFLQTVWDDLHDEEQNTMGLQLTVYEWQLIFIRMYIGFDLIPHFCEKLFAGTAIQAVDITYFASVHMPAPYYSVLLAGLIECCGALAIGCGFMTRLAAIILFIYIMLASIIGHHFENGFIWASAGGGWEYPLLWGILFLSFAVKGANRFSIDGVLQRKFNLPSWIIRLMGRQNFTGLLS